MSERHKTYSDPRSGATCSGRPDLVDAFRRAVERATGEEDGWIARLRADGVRAAHPDDGWVDRDAGTVRFVYPQFDDGVVPGCVVALGWPDGHRLVRLLERIGDTGLEWRFSPLPGPRKPLDNIGDPTV